MIRKIVTDSVHLNPEKKELIHIFETKSTIKILVFLKTLLWHNQLNRAANNNLIGGHVISVTEG